MKNISVNVVSNIEGFETYKGKKTKADIWKSVIEQLTDPTTGMEESERKAYEQKILRKLKSGKRLAVEELNYLQIHNPELYRTARRVENERKVLQTKLENCSSKEEVRQVISAQMGILRMMKEDPDREYLAAMIKKEIGDFQKSSAYARLPEESEEGKRMSGKKKKQESFEETFYKEIYRTVNIYVRTYFQCERIENMSAFI